MNIYEYQGKEILRKFNVTIPQGILCMNVNEAINAAKKIGGNSWIIKAQIHAGGRGKCGGIKLAKSLEQVKKYVKKILGMQLITSQTNKKGENVFCVLIEEYIDIKKELYISFMTDRVQQNIIFIGSNKGGMDIEIISKNSPELLYKTIIDPLVGLTKNNIDNISKKISVPKRSLINFYEEIQKIYKTYWETDALLLEINPLIINPKNKIISLDIKFNFDTNALFRHPEIISYQYAHKKNINKIDLMEIEASKFDLTYIPLNGNIGCLVNGAGLAMATMDTIKLFGGEPANFLDIGGNATIKTIIKAFKIMIQQKNLKAILVNIFGGIVRCDIVAHGIISAFESLLLDIPLIVRMKGTNEDIGKKILTQSNLPIINVNNLEEAVKKAIFISKNNNLK
ncbi:succinate--CoA ligase [ADP-forming] subunit beta [Candidatus Profftella armatura (Diaphorina cf. continua)]|uniref:Succinate--CoA ligase [ADP-forming] subunit beta n=1 Tax=Candidatus Profftella armatura (Diaphorina cf. continua) TaxID=2661583 RepID=A0A7R6VYZ4_9PROT|nr:ADP-forming succinate--CoA ligase subunit beta [Candidatus Profftella armatura (Diaphorina cf. continua)]BCG49762.1 succinate--CoA ligase [ADP-forming] subunit beta [Candidatus Profftella armatura (Diaphorina cf. continua)]